MTEAEWLASDDPTAMLRLVDGAFMAGSASDWKSPMRASDRKLRLWMAACCRLCHTPDEMYAVDVAEQIADGLATDRERSRVHGSTVGGGTWAVCHSNVNQAALHILGDNHFRGHESELANLLREIVGNPFRPWMREDAFARGGCLPGQTLNIVWQSWLTPDVLMLAGRAYEERARRGWSGMAEGEMGPEYQSVLIQDGSLDPVTLAAVADAMEEAGCVGERCKNCHGSGTYSVQVRNTWLSVANGYGTATTYSEWRGCRHCGGDHDRKGTGQLPNPLLAHLRSPGPHVRGCWAVDLILGRE